MIRKRNTAVTAATATTRTRSSSTSSSEDEAVSMAVRRKRPRGGEAIPTTTAENNLPLPTTVLTGDEAIQETIKFGSAVVDVDEKDLVKKPKSKFGPTTAPVYVRATTMVDYARDVCKDYKETGYCGFGDSCIYLHDRSNYVSSDQLDKKWEELNKLNKTKRTMAVSEEMHGCPICRKPFSEGQPLVKTKCGHVACRTCAMERFRKDPTCASCGVATQGIFNDYVRLPM